MTLDASPPASKYMFSETVVGPMLDVEQTLCPHHEVKLTFMKLKVTGWLSVSVWLYKTLLFRASSANMVCS